MELTNIKTIQTLLTQNGFSFSKKLGQNFLINPSVCPKIAQYAQADKNCGVLEIGPGIGVLTAELAKAAKKVVAVEIDSKLLPVLNQTLADFDNVKIINADVLKLDLHNLIAQEFEGMDVLVCANLPYYITSPIIMKLLESRLPVKSITVMVQKEAAQRICAPPGTRAAGAISVAVDFFCTPKILFSVSRGSFMPAPNVDSAVIQLCVPEKPKYAVTGEKLFFKTVKSAFGQRRKTILNALSAGLSLDKPALSEVLSLSGVSPQARAEQLTTAQFITISENLYLKGF